MLLVIGSHGDGFHGDVSATRGTVVNWSNVSIFSDNVSLCDWVIEGVIIIAVGVSPSAGAAVVLPVAVVRRTALPMLVGFIVMMTSSLILI